MTTFSENKSLDRITAQGLSRSGASASSTPALTTPLSGNGATSASHGQPKDEPEGPRDLQQVSTGNSVGWESSFLAGDYVGALPGLEAALSEGNSSLKVKLCWVRSHLELGTMPIIALTSPLQQALGEEAPEAALAPLAVSTLVLLGRKLEEKGQLRLCIVILKSALSSAEHLSDTDSALDAHDVKVVCDYYLHVLGREVDAHKTKPGSKGYLAGLEAEQRRAEAKKQELARREKRERTNGAPPQKDADLRAPLPAESSPQLEKDEFILGETGLKTEPLAAQTPRERARRKGRTRALWGAALCCLFGIAAWGLYSEHPEDFEPGSLTAFQGTIRESNRSAAVPVMKLAAIDPLLHKLSLLSTNLDTVGERLKNIPLGDSPNDGSAPSTGSTAPPKDNEVDQAALDSGAKKLPAPKPGSDEVVPLIERASTEPLPPPDTRNAPYLNPDRVAGIDVTEVGGSLRSRGGEPVPLSERLRTPVSDVDLAARERREGATTLDGSPLRSYEVIEFPRPAHFKTITGTRVLSAPSVIASPVVDLPRDTSVQVVARMGQWLELRSVGGQRGYIYSQDAVEAENVPPVPLPPARR